MFPILQLGPVALQVPGLVLLLGVWLALSLAEKEAARLAPLAPGLHPDALYRLALVGLVAGLIGARLAYAGRYLGAYAADPLGLISPNPATLAAPEGLFIGVVAAAFYGGRRRMPLRLTLDALAPGLAVMGVGVALAHAASGDAFGAPTQVPWRIYLWDDYRHPSQLYELGAALLVLAAWWRVRQRPAAPADSGFNFWLVVALLAGARVFLEAFRGDSLLLPGGLRVAQVWGLLVLGVGLGMMRRWGIAPDKGAPSPSRNSVAG